MNAPANINTGYLFTQTQLDRLIADQERRVAAIMAGSGWNKERAASARRNIIRLAAAAMDALNGEEGFGPDDHIELQAAMEAFGCDSIWTALQPSYAAMLDRGQRAYVRNGGAA